MVTDHSESKRGNSLQPHLSDYFPTDRIAHMVCDILYGVMHIKEPLLLIGKSSQCGGSGFPLSLCEWYFNM